MTLSKTFVGTTILAMYCILGSISFGQESIRSSLLKSSSQAQSLNFSMDEDPLCLLARQLAAWICGDTANDGIDQLTDGFVDEVDESTWDSLEPLITRSIADIDLILDPNKMPSLDPYDAGSCAVAPDTSSWTTEDMGDDLCERALAAVEELCNSTEPDQEYAGMLIREMRYVLEDLYDQAQP